MGTESQTPADTRPKLTTGFYVAALLAFAMVISIYDLHETKGKLDRLRDENTKLSDANAKQQHQLDSSQHEMDAITGLWRCETTMPDTKGVPVSVGAALELKKQGPAHFVLTEKGQMTQEIEGAWLIVGAYLIIQKHPEGFAAFKIVSKGDNKLSLLSRTGHIFEYTRIN